MKILILHQIKVYDIKRKEEIIQFNILFFFQTKIIKVILIKVESSYNKLLLYLGYVIQVIIEYTKCRIQIKYLDNIN